MKIKVLLVDDEEKFAIMLAKRLALRGIDVDYVFTGQDAIQKVENTRYDVIILDVKMPGIGGIELKRKLERITPGMKMIFLTGHGSKSDFENGMLEGVLYLAKPLKIENLVKTLHQLAET